MLAGHTKIIFPSMASWQASYRMRRFLREIEKNISELWIIFQRRRIFEIFNKILDKLL